MSAVRQSAECRKAEILAGGAWSRWALADVCSAWMEHEDAQWFALGFALVVLAVSL